MTDPVVAGVCGVPLRTSKREGAHREAIGGTGAALIEKVCALRWENDAEKKRRDAGFTRVLNFHRGLQMQRRDKPPTLAEYSDDHIVNSIAV